MTDIDIDFANRDDILEKIHHVSAVIDKPTTERKKHPTGIYFQNIPQSPIDGLAALDYEKAEGFGYLKIDFLNNSIYRNIKDEEHLEILLNKEPDWSLFQHEEIVSELAHISNHFSIVSSISPQSIEDLAIILALIRPGKRYLLNKSRKEIDQEIWKPEAGSYIFKKSHAIAYAVSIVVQLNLLCEEN